MKETLLEKLKGLYKVYYEIKHNYPDKQKLRDIKWEEALERFQKLVIESESIDEYYSVLMRYVSLVNDGHTLIMPPWLANPQASSFSKPALELDYIEGKIIVSRVGNVEELHRYNIMPGDVITHIDDKEVSEVLEDINRMYARGSEQANNRINPYFLLLGEKSEKVSIRLERLNENIELTRSIKEDDGKYFIDRLIDFRNPYRIKKLDDDIYYVYILSFSTLDIAASICDILKENPKGIIFDLRYCLGGNDRVTGKLISHLIKEPVLSPIWRCEFYNQAFELWGREAPYEDIQNKILPAENHIYDNPVVILTSGRTSSTAEDMAITLKYAKRAKIIGERTAGSSGNPKTFALPYGGTLDVSSFIPLTPLKEEYLGIGIEPDYECHNTIASVRNDRDLVLEKAREYISLK